jgi:hypothetical protein
MVDPTVPPSPVPTRRSSGVQLLVVFTLLSIVIPFVVALLARLLIEI